MNTSPRSIVLLLALLAASVFGVVTTAHAQASTVITSLPYVINAKDLYVLNSDLSSAQTSSNLITVGANNVTLDFQGHFISGPVGVTSQSVYGVRASEKSNVAIRNGTIVYCYYGIRLDGNN